MHTRVRLISPPGDLLHTLLLEGLPTGTTRVNGPADDAHRLPNTLSIGLQHVRSSALLASLSEQVGRAKSVSQSVSQSVISKGVSK